MWKRLQPPPTTQLWRLTLPPPQVVPPIVFIKLSAKNVKEITQMPGMPGVSCFCVFMQRGKIQGGCNHPLVRRGLSCGKFSVNKNKVATAEAVFKQYSTILTVLDVWQLNCDGLNNSWNAPSEASQLMFIEVNRISLKDHTLVHSL